MVLNKEKLLEVKHLKKYFSQGKKDEVRAVDDISFDIYKGETFGLVGESGCGKSTTGRLILNLYEVTSGEILYKGKNIQRTKSKKDAKEFQKSIQMIFQDPFASLNPRMRVKDIIAEGLDIHKLTSNNKEREEKVLSMLETVGLSRNHADLFPHEFSGGQRQRIGIARALAVNPELIIADEAISALDVSIQSQIVNLLKDLQEQNDLTFLFIAHDLSMVRYISDRIGVMYKGKLVEIAEANELYDSPLHPYTESLLSAIPIPDPLQERARQRKYFDKSSFDKNKHEQLHMHEVSHGHFVYCTEEEVPVLQEKLKEYQHLRK